MLLRAPSNQDKDRDDQQLREIEVAMATDAAHVVDRDSSLSSKSGSAGCNASNWSAGAAGCFPRPRLPQRIEDAAAQHQIVDPVLARRHGRQVPRRAVASSLLLASVHAAGRAAGGHVAQIGKLVLALIALQAAREQALLDEAIQSR